MKRISDKEVMNAIDLLINNNGNEMINRDVLILYLKLLLNIRQDLNRLLKKPKVYKKPTGRKKDIITGSSPSKGYWS